jgi:hypothetical protein
MSGGLALVAFMTYPLAVDLGLGFLGLWCAGRKRRLQLLLALYVVLNVFAPLAFAVLVFGDDWPWLVGLFLLVKVIEFGGFKVGAFYRDLWREPRTRDGLPSDH